jgi:gliding motility-associated-like protein
MQEFENPASCENMIDLDCNDSDSSVDFSCLDINGVSITDTDIRLFANDWLTEMTITIASPIPNAPFEILNMTGSIPNIDDADSGTSMITLTNVGGATIQDFKDALQLIVYHNLSPQPTSGIRTIEVQFTTESGAMSNVAEYFINVEDLDHLLVDLGPDIEICDGSSLTLDAGHPGAMHEWSTGESSQTISVDESGEYIVTVSNGILCPGIDTVIIDVLPNIEVALTGDPYICDNEQATLTIQTDSPFPLTITIEADPGSPFVFTGISGTYSFTDLPFVTTEYTITEVVADQSCCIVISNPGPVIEVYSTYVFENEVSLCDGDSIWLGFYWETEAGVYENHLETEYGCDSTVTTYLTILPAVMVQVQSDTCDPSGAGVFITHLDNPNGCDTVVTTTITLLPSDTTHISFNTCVSTQTGFVTDIFSNQAGCDSLVITTTSYVPPADTTYLHDESCDSSQVGIKYYAATGSDGCDSIVALTVSFLLIDTTYTSGTSCIPSEIGVFETFLTDASGCDSLVISMVTQGQADTTALFTTSCDPASLGVFEELLTSSQGCDSLIITTVTFSAQDSTFINSSTCDPVAAGVFLTLLINQFGCDSIVTETISLLPSNATSLSSTTCDPSAAGIFTQMHPNQYGCDSIVTETVTLLPSDQTTLASNTCIASQAGVFISTLTNQYGCDSVITETITLLLGDTTYLWTESCDSSQVGIKYYAATGSDGCDSLVIETTILYPLPVLQVQSATDYNGFDIRCAGDADGSAIANASGTAPFTYLWSTTETDPLIAGLSAGAYAVSVTDGNGCTTDGVITLAEPTVFMIGFEISEPDCFDQQLGSITVKVNGGVAPYTYSIDGTIFQSSPDFTGLSEGIYQITSLDANDCSATEIISIDVPLMVQVELGDNQVISIGDSTHLQAIINLPFDSLASIIWTGIDSIDCPNCLTQLVAPIITTAYTVSVTSVDGCADRDSLTVTVTTDQNVYIPNIFSPNGDGVNDVLSISIGDGVEEISSFTIFDRWGNMIFLAEHVLPSEPIVSWDGRMKGETMNPGVFTYKLVAQFKDGERIVRYGDITLLR